MTDLKPCPFCGNEPDSSRDEYIECVNRDCPISFQLFGIDEWNTRHITRADIPEALVREVQAEALEKAASKLYMRCWFDEEEEFMVPVERLEEQAAKLREQKDETPERN